MFPEAEFKEFEPRLKFKPRLKFFKFGLRRIRKSEFVAKTQFLLINFQLVYAFLSDINRHLIVDQFLVLNGIEEFIELPDFSLDKYVKDVPL